jgi:hypothetical protein
MAPSRLANPGLRDFSSLTGATGLGMSFNLMKTLMGESNRPDFRLRHYTGYFAHPENRKKSAGRMGEAGDSGRIRMVTATVTRPERSRERITIITIEVIFETPK